MNVHTKAQVLAADKVVTGSIVKVFATQPDTKLVDCKFGNFVNAGDDHSLASSSVHLATETDIHFPSGSYLEGPFAAIHVNNKVTVVYYNGELKID